MQFYRDVIIDYIRSNAKPPDKFSHQERLYRLAVQIAGDKPFDEEVVFAAAWLHDLGVFIGHRPDDPSELQQWDHIGYVVREVPLLLLNWGFPEHKISAVLEVVKTHMPHHEPVTFEATLVRDADILEQLGVVGILRTVSKTGRDTRFIYFEDALKVLRKNLDTLPGLLKLQSSVELARDRVKTLSAFLEAAEVELRSGS